MKHKWKRKWSKVKIDRTEKPGATNVNDDDDDDESNDDQSSSMTTTASAQIND